MPNSSSYKTFCTDWVSQYGTQEKHSPVTIEGGRINGIYRVVIKYEKL
jgi:hypothetical protein